MGPTCNDATVFPFNLKHLNTGSQSLYRQVQRDANWASQCQLSVNDQGLVIKWGSRIVVPEDEELRSLLIGEFHDSKYAGPTLDVTNSVRSWSHVVVECLARDVAKFVSTCVACQKQGLSPQALRTATFVTYPGEALAYGDLRFYCQAS
jgi:hypothetical protein